MAASVVGAEFAHHAHHGHPHASGGHGGSDPGPGAEEKEQWIKSEQADMVFGGVIILNAIVIGIDIEVTIANGGESSKALFWIQFAFLVVFLVELGLRVRADGPKFFSPRNPSGIFDLVIIIASTTEVSVALTGSGAQLPAVGVMRVFRLLRIARIARILHIFPELSQLISGLAASVQAVFWVFLLLVVILYVCSLLTAMQLGQDTSNEELRYYFGGVGRAFFTHFMVLTLEGYPSVARAAGQPAAYNWYWYLYFVGFIIFSNVILMNLVTGIVCESVVANAHDEEKASDVYEQESRRFQEVLEDLLEMKDIKAEDEIRFDEGQHPFRELINDENIRELLNTIDICLEMDDLQLFHILDEEDKGSLSRDQLIRSLIKLRGTKESLHSLLVQADVIRGSRRVVDQIRKSATSIQNYSSTVANALRERVSHSLVDVRSQLEERARAAQRDPPLPPPASSPWGEAGSPLSYNSGSGPSAAQMVMAAAARHAEDPQLAHEPDVQRVRAAIAAAEEGAAQAEAALERIQSELLASRARVKALEARLNRRSEGAQTDPEPPSLPHDGPSPASQPRARLGLRCSTGAPVESADAASFFDPTQSTAPQERQQPRPGVDSPEHRWGGAVAVAC